MQARTIKAKAALLVRYPLIMSLYEQMVDSVPPVMKDDEFWADKTRRALLENELAKMVRVAIQA